MRTFDENRLNWKQKVWRYMRINRFYEFIESRKIHFSSANQFSDPFEGAVVVKPYGSEDAVEKHKLGRIEKSFEELKRLTKISCWHIEDHESDAMWKLYSGAGKGIAISSSPEKIRESLEPYRIQPEYGIEELWGANVSYVDLVKECLNVSMLERFYFKHYAFSWEKEFRLAISLRLAEDMGVSVPEKGIFVGADIFNLIDEIHIGPSVASEQRDKVLELCHSLGLGDRVNISSLLGSPRYI